MTTKQISVRVQTMTALILSEPGCIELKKVPIPEPGPGEIRIRVSCATSCGTDLKAFLRGHPQIPMPGVFGHEYSGVVDAVGEGAPFMVGDEVMGVHSAPCMECEWCARGEENLCEHIMRTKVLGSYAEYLVIPAHIAKHNVFLKPGFVSFARAALLEPLACVTHGLSLLKMVKSDRVLVIGPGAIGLMFVAALRAVGIKDITLAGRNPSRLDVGAKMGAKTILLEEIPAHMGTGYDSVIECTGRVEIWERSIDFVRRGGQVMLFGGCPAGTKACFDTKRLHYDQITLISPFHFGTVAVRKAKALLEDLTIPFELLISGDRKLSEAEQVFEDLQRGRGIKYVFRP